jgi:hypothetical protein
VPAPHISPQSSFAAHVSETAIGCPACLSVNRMHCTTVLVAFAHPGGGGAIIRLSVCFVIPLADPFRRSSRSVVSRLTGWRRRVPSGQAADGASACRTPEAVLDTLTARVGLSEYFAALDAMRDSAAFAEASASRDGLEPLTRTTAAAAIAGDAGAPSPGPRTAWRIDPGNAFL